MPTNANGDERRTVSPREREVGSLIALGFTNREIGERLGITEETVKRHVSNLMLKLMVSRRTQIAIIAARGGWMDAWTSHEIKAVRNK